MMKSFRGLIAHDTIQTIRLSTNTGLTGYKIRKLQIFPQLPNSTSTEATFQVYSVKPSATSDEVNFDDPLLLAMAYYSASSSSESYPDDLTVIFDNTTINQDIYLTMRNVQSGNNNVNYYLELEQIKLEQNEAAVATLKDMRGSN